MDQPKFAAGSDLRFEGSRLGIGRGTPRAGSRGTFQRHGKAALRTRRPRASRLLSLPFRERRQRIDRFAAGMEGQQCAKELNQDAKAVAYVLKVEDDKGTLRLRRMLR